MAFPTPDPGISHPPHRRRVHMRKGVIEVIEMEVHTFTMTPSLLQGHSWPQKKAPCKPPTNCPNKKVCFFELFPSSVQFHKCSFFSFRKKKDPSNCRTSFGGIETPIRVEVRNLDIKKGTTHKKDTHKKYEGFLENNSHERYFFGCMQFVLFFHLRKQSNTKDPLNLLLHTVKHIYIYMCIYDIRPS